MKIRIFQFIIALFAFSNVSLFSQEVLPILVQNTPFALIDNLDNDDSKYTDLEILKKDWPAYLLPKGMKVEVLGYDSYDAMLTVKLPDGSIGYIPTMAVALNEMSFVTEREYSYAPPGSFNQRVTYPPGRYKVVAVGQFEYMKKLDWKHSVQPSYLVLQHESGKRFRTNIGTLNTAGGDLATRFMMYNGPAIFEGFFANHPGIADLDDHNVLRFKLKDGKLPVTLLGYSRSYIESVLGRPFSYVGYAISPFNGYTYSCHTNVAWDTETNKKQDDSGLIIYYDKNQIAVHMEKCPIDFYYDSFFTKLYTPSKPGAAVNPDMGEIIEASRRGDAPAYRTGRAVHKEIYTAPGNIYRTWIKLIYCLEYTFGIYNRWAILGLLILFNFVVSLLVCVIVRYTLPFSNDTLKIVSYLLNVPVSLFVVIYISRFYIIAAILASLLAIGFANFGASLLFNTIDSSRCNRCRTWLDKPIVVDEVECQIQVSDPSFTLGTGITVGTHNSTEYRDGKQISHFSRARNFKSTVRLTTPYIQTLKCPECGYQWKYTRYETREVPGPIYFSESTQSTSKWNETEVTSRQIKNRSNGEILHEEEIGRRSVTRTASLPSSSNSGYDVARYNEYLHRYINGDYGALHEYERKYWGNYFG
ncbi:MAG: hypothetical protein II318_07525 [Bacteroidales bacterium]|nr:hypothetical protein [Bacteroidales bacterium]